jgi:hypothetical protein
MSLHARKGKNALLAFSTENTISAGANGTKISSAKEKFLGLN